MPTLRRAACTAFLSALLALPLAGCGGGGEPIPDENLPATDEPAEPPLPGDEDATEQLDGEGTSSAGASAGA